MATNEIAAEHERRLALWAQLRQRGGPSRVTPALVRELRIHRGQQGIFRDHTATASLTPGGKGTAVALLHTGSSYADDLCDDGVIYHDPITKRGQRDRNEVAAIKACGALSLPIFVVITPTSNSDTRDVRLGWVTDTDD